VSFSAGGVGLSQRRSRPRPVDDFIVQESSDEESDHSFNPNGDGTSDSEPDAKIEEEDLDLDIYQPGPSTSRAVPRTPTAVKKPVKRITKKRKTTKTRKKRKTKKRKTTGKTTTKRKRKVKRRVRIIKVKFF